VSFELDPALRLVLRAVLALLFLAAASHKLGDFNAFVRALEAYAIVPARLARASAACLIAFEIASAAALILFASPAAPLPAALLLVLYSAAIAVNLARGRSDLECGCSLGRSGQRLGWWLVARNLALLGAALLVAPPPSARPLTWLDGFTVAASTASLLFLYRGIENLFAHRSALSDSAARWAGGRPPALPVPGGRR
jgi:hypothetical protein